MPEQSVSSATDESKPPTILAVVMKNESTLSKILVQSYNRDAAIALIRIWLGVMMIYHGTPKMFGDRAGLINWLTEGGVPAPEFFAWMAAFGEFGGGALLILGLLSRPAALLTTITMAVAVFGKHLDDPFGKKELGLAYLTMSLVILIAGPGKYALDRIMIGRRKR